MNLNFLIDENIEHYQHFFADFGQIRTMAGRKIQAQHLNNTDVLLVRSVTQVNAELLSHSPVQFIGSATIGIDHLDTEFFHKKQITWSNASGCNAQAVAEYVITALANIQADCLVERTHFTLGIVGLGNVGSRLARLALQLGWQVQGYDPLVQTEIHHPNFTQVNDLYDILQSNAISLHVPLTKTGDYPTYHLFNEQTFAKMPKQSILINSARGEVVKEQALLADIERTGRKVVLDVFEHEPTISQDLCDAVSIITPHIAGYSLEGKARGTAMIYQALCQYLGREINKSMYELLPECDAKFNAEFPIAENLKQHLNDIYPIMRDDRNLRNCLKDGQISADDFDALRKHYPLRREWVSYGFRF